MSISATLELLVPSKLIAPQPRSFWVHRERLVARLAAIDHARLFVIIAPAGFGKSTLVAQWLHATQSTQGKAHNAQPSALSPRPSPVAWLTLDEHDQDGRRFLTYVAGAVERVCPHSLTNTLPLLTAQEPSPLYLALQAFLVDISALPGGLTLILDDYYTVVAPEVHQVVTYLLRHLPHNCRLVLLSRSDPPLALARLRAEQQLSEIRAIDLRFTLDETEALLTKLLAEAPAAALVSGLYQETEGWAIALHCAALAHQESGTLERAVGIVRRRIAAYLDQEVFDWQPAPIQEALLALAIPERFCAGLYAALLDAPNDLVSAEEHIRGLLHANLLISSLDGEGRWYRFHQLFRNLLQRRLRLQSTTAITTLELRAARWFEHEGLFEEAVRHYLAAGAETAAAELVERLLVPALDRDQRKLPYDAWLRLLPAELVAQRPALLLLQARRATLTLDLDAMATHLQQLDDLLNGQAELHRAPPWPAFPADREALWGVLYFWEGRAAESVATLRAALSSGPEPWVAIQALMLLGQALVALGRRDEALQVAEAFELEGAPAVHMAAARLCRCAIHMHAGDLAAVTREADCLQQLATRAELDPAWYCYAQAFLAGAAYERGDVALAAEYYLAVVQCKGQVSAATHMGCLVALTNIAIAANDLERAADYEQAAWAFAAEAGGRFLRHQAAGAATRFALARGDIAAALRVAAGIEPDIQLGMSLWTATPRLSLVRALLALGEPVALVAADAVVAGCLSEVASLRNTPLLVYCLVLQAHVRQAQGRVSEALDLLEQALQVADSGGLIWAFLDTSADLKPLMQTLEAQGRCKAAVQRILAHSGTPQMRPVPAAPAPHLPDLLTRREHEILELLSARLTDKEIAARLVIAPNTVRKHTSTILGKLGVHSRREAVTAAHALGLLPRAR
jgi:LuxR family transcriptional regulator, maltose regulon positive regulatory protein